MGGWAIFRLFLEYYHHFEAYPRKMKPRTTPRFITWMLLLSVRGLGSKASAAVLIASDTTQAQVDDGSPVDDDSQSNTGGTAPSLDKASLSADRYHW